MNTFEFFNRNFGRYLKTPSNRHYRDAWSVLSEEHEMQDKKPARLMSSWAIVRPSGTVMQQKLKAQGIEYDTRTRAEAFGAELDAWIADSGPRIFLVFGKSLIPIAHLFMTLDLRAVRICSPGGVETFDYSRPAGPEAGRFERELDRRRPRRAA